MIVGVVVLREDVPPFLVLQQLWQVPVELDRDVEFGRLYFPRTVELFFLFPCPHLLMVFPEHSVKLFGVAGRVESSENLYHLVPVEFLLID